MKNKKGFTLIELLAVIAIIGILTGLIVMEVTKYLQRAKNTTYEVFEKDMKIAIDNYFVDNNDEVPDIGGNITVTAETLIDEGYIKTMKDPAATSLRCDTGSYVKVTRAGTTSDFNMDLTYKVCVKCSAYQSAGCN